MRPSELAAAAAAAAAIAALATPLAAALARRLGVLDQPGGYKQHGRAVPLLGGVAVALAAACALGAATGLAPSAGVLALGLGGGIVLLAGLIDDLRGLTPHSKIAWQLGGAACAGLALVLLDVRLELFVPRAVVPMTILTLVWVVGVTNAFNLVDHANGLCAGLSALAAAALAAANFRSGTHDVALAAACVAGAAAGFLPWNFPRARIFLGDAGSMTLGFALAALSVLGVYTPGATLRPLAVAVPVLALAVPLADVAMVVALRLRDGHPPWRGDRRHVGHRLVARGWSPAAATALVWGAGAVTGAIAVAVPWLPAAGALAALGVWVLVLVALAAAAGTRGPP